jgi:DNA-binding PadR family transcriptional regulator
MALRPRAHRGAGGDPTPAGAPPVSVGGTVLSVTDWAVLGAVAQGTTHGFAVARRLGPDGDLGRVWTVHRPLVYRSLAGLESAALIQAVGAAAGQAGPRRTLVRATPAGRRRLRRWLDQPVGHVRDVRSQLLLKLALLDQAGRDPGPLVERQRALLVPMVASLQGQLRRADGFDAVVARWRLESARAVQRFLTSLSATTRGGA